MKVNKRLNCLRTCAQLATLLTICFISGCTPASSDSKAKPNSALLPKVVVPNVAVLPIPSIRKWRNVRFEFQHKPMWVTIEEARAISDIIPLNSRDTWPYKRCHRKLGGDEEFHIGSCTYTTRNRLEVEYSRSFSFNDRLLWANISGLSANEFGRRYNEKGRHLSLVMTAEQILNTDFLAELKLFDGIALQISSLPDKEFTKPFYEALISLGNIESLDLKKMDLTHLPSFPKLIGLYLGSQDLSEADLASIANVGDLSILTLHSFKLKSSDLVPLQRLQNLETLHLATTMDTEIIALLGEFSKLRSLSFILTEDSGSNFEGFKSLHKLEDLRVAAFNDDLSFLENMPQLQKLFLDGNYKDAQIGVLGKLKKLRSLTLSRSQVTGFGLRCLEEHPDLRMLNLHHIPIDDQGMASIGRLKQLRHLDISNTRVTHLGIAHLTNLTHLETLNLSADKLDDQGLASLSTLSKLRVLEIERSAISNKGMRHLTGLENLRTLLMSATKVGDEGLSVLAELKNLEILNLNRTEVSDKSMPLLASFPKLQKLGLHQTHVTKNSKSRLSDLKKRGVRGVWRGEIAAPFLKKKHKK